MDIKEALDIVVSRTQHERFRLLCDPNHPDYNPKYVEYVIHMANNNGEYPSVLTQTGNAIKAATKFIASGLTRVPPQIKEERLAICRQCVFYDAPQIRCKKCGCFLEAKASMASEKCPLDPPKWGRGRDNRNESGKGCGCGQNK